MERMRLLLSVCLVGTGLWSVDARADDYVTCESRIDRYQRCPIATAGYVTLDRQLSGASCTQGRTWDYSRREIWVEQRGTLSPRALKRRGVTGRACS